MVPKIDLEFECCRWKAFGRQLDFLLSPTAGVNHSSYVALPLLATCALMRISTMVRQPLIIARQLKTNLKYASSKLERKHSASQFVVVFHYAPKPMGNRSTTAMYLLKLRQDMLRC